MELRVDTFSSYVCNAPKRISRGGGGHIHVVAASSVCPSRFVHANCQKLLILTKLIDNF